MVMSLSPYRLFFKRKFPAKEGLTVNIRANYVDEKLFIRFRRKFTTAGMPEIIESHIFAFFKMGLSRPLFGIYYFSLVHCLYYNLQLLLGNGDRK